MSDGFRASSWMAAKGRSQALGNDRSLACKITATLWPDCPVSSDRSSRQQTLASDLASARNGSVAVVRLLNIEWHFWPTISRRLPGRLQCERAA